MDFELSEELVAVRELARDFAEKEIAPTAAQDDKERKFRKELLLKMGELGFFGSVIPENYGGNGLGFLAMVLITEEVARIHSAVRVAINMQIGPALALLQFGNEEQKKKWIPPLLRGESVGCFAITEPDAGSDVSAIRTTAAKKNGGYVINGTKLWISNAPVADGGLVYAYTDRSQKHRGLSAFYATFDRPGLTRRTLETLGAHASPLGELTFENFQLSDENLLGKEGGGFTVCMWQLNQTRLNCAAGALGVARAARGSGGELLQPAGAVRPENRPVSDEPGSDRADGCPRRISAPAGVSRRLARRPRKAEQSRDVHGKIYRSGSCRSCHGRGDENPGAYGYSTEFPVERYYRDAKSYQIVEGSSNIQKMIIAQDALGYRKANR